MHMLTGEAVPLAPLALDAVLGIATLGLVLVFIILYGLREGWDHTIGYGLRWIADQVDGFGTISLGFTSVDIFGPLADVFRSADHFVSHALAVGALNAENGAASLWHMTGRVFWWSVHETKALSLDVYHWAYHTATTTIPDAAKWARREAVTVAERITHEEAALRRAADAELGHLAHEAEAHALHAAAAAEGALDWSETQVGHIGREIEALKARVGTLAHTLTPAALVALIGATIFKDFGLGWLRCGNVGRLGRAVCGMSAHLLEDLLGVIAGAILFSSLCEILPLLTAAVDDVGLGLVEAIHASGLSACSGRYPPPPPMPAVALILPKVYGTALVTGA